MSKITVAPTPAQIKRRQRALAYHYANRDAILPKLRAYHHQRNGVARGRRQRGMPEPTRAEPPTCEICGATPRGRIKRLCLDHDHKTGKFRGWLCNTCNTCLGHFGDTSDGIMRALEYLVKAGS